MKSTQKSGSQAGFTLIELMVAVAGLFGAASAALHLFH
jgi:type II secretory pathway pseudopilin PulG